jgi:hypothetical protein
LEAEMLPITNLQLHRNPLGSDGTILLPDTLACTR